MSWPVPGWKIAVLLGDNGFATTAAFTAAGNASAGAIVKTERATVERKAFCFMAVGVLTGLHHAPQEVKAMKGRVPRVRDARQDEQIKRREAERAEDGVAA